MNRTTRLLVVLLVAVAVAGLASYAVYRAVQRIPVKQVEIAQVQVAVAARQISVGTMITPEMVKLVGWPASAQVAGAFSSVEAVVSRGTVVSVAENEPFTESKLAPKESGAGLPPTIPLGMRAMSVKVDEVVGVAGFVVPGTRVDLLVTLTEGDRASTQTVLSNVLVLTAGTRYDQDAPKQDGKPIPTTVVTLAVTPPDAERVALAQSSGKVMLALRNPLDDQPTQTSGVRLAALLGGATPAPVQREVKGRKMFVAPKVEAPPPPPKLYTVETIRAAKRTEETVK